MSILATVVLDSGILFLEGMKGPLSSLDVGYFDPRIVIYVDGEEVYESQPGQIGKNLEVRHQNDNRLNQTIPFSKCMGSKLLRLSKLYDGKKQPTIRR